MEFERGCLMDSEKIRMLCSTPSSFHYAIFCCSEEMCNSNTTARSLMARLPTGGYHVTCSTRMRFMEYYHLVSSFISPWRRAGPVSGWDVGSLHTGPSSGSGSAFSGLGSGLQTVSSGASAAAAGVWYRTGSNRWSHHLQRGRQHFSGKSTVDSINPLVYRQRSSFVLFFEVGSCVGMFAPISQQRA